MTDLKAPVGEIRSMTATGGPGSSLQHHGAVAVSAADTRRRDGGTDPPSSVFGRAEQSCKARVAVDRLSLPARAPSDLLSQTLAVCRRRDDLGKGPLGHRVTDRLLHTLDTLALLAHRPQKLFERNTLLAMLELLQHEPIHVGRPPHLLARIISPAPKHERGDLLALAFEVFARCLTGAREISHRLMPLVGHPDRGEFPGAR